VARLCVRGDPVQKQPLLGWQHQGVWWHPNWLAVTVCNFGWHREASEGWNLDTEVLAHHNDLGIAGDSAAWGWPIIMPTLKCNILIARLMLKIEQRSWKDEAHPKLSAGRLHQSPEGCGSATCLD